MRAPRVMKGKVLIGNGGAELGVRGYITAYDANDGKQLWRFFTVPGDPSLGFEQPILAEAAKTWKGGGGVITDLRWSAVARDSDAWKSVVLGGALKNRGMVSFSSVIDADDADDAEALRAYVTLRSSQSQPPL